jgi:hypothetical protein
MSTKTLLPAFPSGSLIIYPGENSTKIFRLSFSLAESDIITGVVSIEASSYIMSQGDTPYDIKHVRLEVSGQKYPTAFTPGKKNDQQIIMLQNASMYHSTNPKIRAIITLPNSRADYSREGKAEVQWQIGTNWGSEPDCRVITKWVDSVYS